MEWSEFLTDVELNSSIYPNRPNGQLLFRKVVHDVLECLTGYRECVKIVTSQKDDVADDILTWLNNWETPVSTWINEIIFLEEQSREVSDTSLAWPNLIANLGKILELAPQIKSEEGAFTLPSEEKLKFIIQTAIRLTQRLNFLWLDIQDKEYKRLWITKKYGDFVE